MDKPPSQAALTSEQDDEVPPFLLSEDEQRVLTLYDELRDLEVKIALVKAQQSYTPASSAPNDEENLRKAQEDAAAARAGWLLRNEITDSAITANPILKAVHGSTQSTPIESDLLTHINARDNTSVALAQTSNEIRAALDKLTEVEAESLRVSRRNVELAAEVIRLAEEAEKRKTGETGDPAVQAQMARLQAELKASRQRWKVTKGTASAIVVGSGVDWARDAELRDMVLDPEEE